MLLGELRTDEYRTHEPKPSVEQFHLFWSATMKEIAAAYVDGTAAFIKANYPEIRQQLDGAWDAMVTHWGNDIDSFRVELDRWSDLQFTAIRLFRERQADTTTDSPESEPHSPIQSTFPGFESEARRPAQRMENVGRSRTPTQEPK